MSNEYTPWQPPAPGPITVESVYKNTWYPQPGERVESDEHGPCVATNEFRPPLENELLWSFDCSGVFRAKRDWSIPRIIMRRVKTIQVPQVVRPLPGRKAQVGDWVARTGNHPSLYRRNSEFLHSDEYLVEVEMVEMEVPE